MKQSENLIPYLIYGAGGHARVLMEGLTSVYGHNIVKGFFNDGEEPTFLSDVLVDRYRSDNNPQAKLLLGVGLPDIRKKLAAKVSHQFGTFIHPSATVAKDVEIGEGTVVLAGAVIQTGAKIGKHVIINANVTIDHDAVVEDYVTTYPGVYVGANAIVSEGTLISPNTTIMRNSITQPFSEIEPGMVYNTKFN